MIFNESVLMTERLLVEPLLPMHAEEMFEILQDKEIYKFIPTHPPKDIDELKARYARLKTRFSPDKSQMWLNWVLRQKADNSLIGRFEATIYEDETACIAYELCSRFWGKGFAYEASEKLIDTLKREYQVTKVKANVDTRNSSSIRLLEKLNFQKVNFIKNADYFNGSASDEYEFELKPKKLKG
jgi:[ribosomal protein S5]-alanine N-acetyltransferase